MVSVRVLRSTVVSPDDYVLNISHGAASFLCDLAKGSGLIKSSHASEVSLRDRRGIV